MKVTVVHHFNYSASSVQSHAFLYFCHSHPTKSPKLDCLHSVSTPRLMSTGSVTWGRNTFKLSKLFLGCYDVAIWMTCL